MISERLEPYAVTKLPEELKQWWIARVIASMTDSFKMMATREIV